MLSEAVQHHRLSRPSVHWLSVFDTLSERLGSALGDLRKRGKLDDETISRAMREIRLALIEADVELGVVRTFVDGVRERARGEEVLKSLTPGQMVVKAVHDELTELLGEDTAELELGQFSVILLAGLQGSGKTTAAAKLALQLKEQRAQAGPRRRRPRAPRRDRPARAARRADRRPGLPHRHDRSGRGGARRGSSGRAPTASTR